MMSLYLTFVNPPHQQHVISDCGFCLLLMLQNHGNNESEKVEADTVKGAAWCERNHMVLTVKSFQRG